MTTTIAPALATEAQIKYVSSLLSERVSNEHYASAMASVIAKGELSRRDASKAIDYLNTCPRKPREAAAPRFNDPRRQQVAELLATLPMARYAIPTDELPAMFSQRVSGDLLFVRISEYRNIVRFARLHGAPGAFNTSRVSIPDVELLAKVIESAPQRYTKLFADHYSVCGKCLAPLTDQTSRERGLGPTCAKGFGY